MIDLIFQGRGRSMHFKLVYRKSSYKDRNGTMKSYHLKTSKHFGVNSSCTERIWFNISFTWSAQMIETLVIMSNTKLHFKFLIRSLGPFFRLGPRFFLLESWLAQSSHPKNILRWTFKGLVCPANRWSEAHSYYLTKKHLSLLQFSCVIGNILQLQAKKQCKVT